MRAGLFITIVVLALAALAAQQPAPPQAASGQPAPAKVSPKEANPFLGTWDVPIPNPGPNGENRGNRNCWLEVKLEGDHLTGRWLSGGGNPTVIRDITVEKGELRFTLGRGGPRAAGPTVAPGIPGVAAQGAQGPPGAQGQRQGAPVQGAQGQGAPGAQTQRAPQTPQIYTAVVKKGKLEGKITQGDRPPVLWTGVRPPKWPSKLPNRKPGTPVALFNGKDLAGWHPQAPAAPNRPYNPAPLGWIVADGALHNPNAPASADIVSDQKFKDFKLEVEFKVVKGTNSGVYLRGRHEIQIQDNYGRQPGLLTHGAIYGFVAAAVEASLPPEEWQKLEVTLIANRVTIIMNGKKIHDNVAIPGITGGAIDTDEGAPGPIMLQGDHSRVYYRKVVVTPLI